ncbi:MAG: glutaredoxin family protein [Planctomycetes bacterium]|nr:glutaredoxin family protein [Planctomycetota bacterium]
MALASFWNWLTRSPTQRPDLHFLLYTRAACPLCDEAWELLVRYQKRYGFVLETRDIDASADLVHEFGQCVPVVAINGKVRFRGHVNEVLLQRILIHEGPPRDTKES